MRGSSRYKLKQLILYIAFRTKDALNFGATKINKVLARSDFAAFRELGTKLTEFRYQKNEYGPTLRAFMPVTAEMVSENLVKWEERSVGSVHENRLLALVEPDMQAFSPEEVELVDREIERAWNATAREVSDEEHCTAAWYATRMNETVKPELCFVEDPGAMLPLSDAEQTRAAAAIERYLARTRPAAHPRVRAGVH